MVTMEVHMPHPPAPDLAELALPGPPCSAQRQLRLPPEQASPGAARNLVADACQAWRLLPLLHSGRAVISELVANAVEHARTDLDVTVSLRGSSVHLAVRDGSPALPRLLELARPAPGRPLDDRGFGLRVVEADSTAWGAVPVAGGKVVWAVVRSRENRPRPW